MVENVPPEAEKTRKNLKPSRGLKTLFKQIKKKVRHVLQTLCGGKN